MKKYIHIISATLSILLSCKKTDTTLTQASQVTCQLTTISSNFAGSNTNATYEYNKDGKLIGIKNYLSNILQNTSTLDEYNIQSSYTSSAGFPMVQTIVYEGGSIFSDQLPTKASVAMQEGLITHTDVFTYYFYYDNKSRLTKVSEETINVVGDWEYDVEIVYNDQDNVTAMKYTWTTGPNTSTTIPASGYDTKPSPYSGLRTWKYLVSWNNSDPTALFAQLSKNNPLGFLDGDWTRTMTYTYNEHGYPLIRTNVQTVKGSADTAKWTETFGYSCP